MAVTQDTIRAKYLEKIMDLADILEKNIDDTMLKNHCINGRLGLELPVSMYHLFGNINLTSIVIDVIDVLKSRYQAAKWKDIEFYNYRIEPSDGECGYEFYTDFKLIGISKWQLEQKK